MAINMKLTVLIPAFNEASNIVATLNEVASVLDDISMVKSHEIIVVDDHSSDETYDIINDLDKENVNCIRLNKQSGSHTAIRAGLAFAKGDATLIIAADGQDNPQAFKDVLEKWYEGADVVWALRRERKEPLSSKFFALTFYRLLKWVNQEDSARVDFSRADFFLLDRKATDAIVACNERNTSFFGLLNWIGFNHEQVEYDRRERRSGKSKWTFKKKLHLSLDWILAFSGLPLKLMTFVGFIVALLGFLYAVFLILKDLFIGTPIQGWSSLMVVILFIGGIQMIMFGVVGEYLWRNLEETRKRPLYFVERSTSDKKNKRRTKMDT